MAKSTLFLTEDGRTYKSKVDPYLNEFFSNDPYIDDPLFIDFTKEKVEPWQEIELTRLGEKFKITNFHPDWAEKCRN